MIHLQEFLALLRPTELLGLIDVNKYISLSSLSAGCEHGLAGRGKHKTVIEMDKSQMSIYSSKLKGWINKQLDKDKN